MASDKDIVQDIIEAENQSLADFQPLWDEADRNKEIYGLKLWTDEERAKIEGQGRIAYNLDRTNHAINTILGAQRESRTDIFFYPQTKDDEQRVEIYNAVWKCFANMYQYKSVESDVFTDGLISKYGVFGCEMDKMRDPRGNLKVGRVPYNEILWDSNFREYDLSDAYWMSRMRFYQRNELEKKYPDKAEIVKMAGMDWGFVDSLTKIRQDRWYNPKKELIGVREFFEREFVRKYFIWQTNANTLLEGGFDSKKGATEQIARLNQQFDMAVMQGQADPLSRPQYEIEDFPHAIVKKTVAVINGVLEEPEVFDMGDFPFTVYFPYFYDGQFWSAIDRIKDPQKFESRMFAQLDHWVGVMAKGLLRIDPKMSDSEQKKVQEQWAKTGGVVKAKEGQLEQIQSAGPAPQLFSILDRVDALAKEVFGGANQLGLKQTASESGRAVMARLSQANLDNLVALSNLTRTKQSLGSKITWYLSNQVSAPRVLRIVGDDIAMESLEKMGEYFQRSESRPSQGYLTINTEPSNSIENLEVDVIVDEAEVSPTKNMQMLNQLTDFGKTGLLTSPPPPEVVLELLPIPYSLKQAWKKSLANQQPPPPKIATNFKDLPPDIQAQHLEQLGFDVDQQKLILKQIFDKTKPADMLPQEKKDETKSS